MELLFKNQHDFQDWVTHVLLDNCIKLFYKVSKEKNYYIQVGIIAEILDWSNEFTEIYYDKTINWDLFKNSKKNIHDAPTLYDLIIVFGQEKIKKIGSQNKRCGDYFMEKYAALQSQN